MAEIVQYEQKYLLSVVVSLLKLENINRKIYSKYKKYI